MESFNYWIFAIICSHLRPFEPSNHNKFDKWTTRLYFGLKFERQDDNG